MAIKFNFIISSVFIFSTSVLSGFDTHKYLVYRNKFPADADNVDIAIVNKKPGFLNLDDLGYKNRQQPSENTRYSVVKNTDVAILEITFSTLEEEILYQKMESDGRLFLFEISNIFQDYNERGEYRTSVKKIFSKPLPVDINKDWSVKISS